jgi:hypothetical protein
MDCFLDGVKYAGRVEMSNSRNKTYSRRFINGIHYTANMIRSTAKKVCGTREEEEPFTNDDHVELVRLVELLKMPFINDHPNDRNVYQLYMNEFNKLTIEQQAYIIPEYIKRVNGHNSNVKHHLIAPSYTEVSTTKLNTSSKYEFGITTTTKISYTNNLTSWRNYSEYLSEYVDFIDKISCKTYKGTEVSRLTLAALLDAFPSAAFPSAPTSTPSPVLGSTRLPITPRGKGKLPAQAPVSSGGRRTKRTKHHRRTKRAKRSKHTRRHKH